jgi:thiol-disulfide isomerase/thioredoxin
MKKILITILAVALICGMGTALEAAELFPAFSSTTLDGKTVTNSIFADKKLTMVNIWATWCPPCLHEMPDLGELGRSMPEGTQLAGIILDVKEGDDDTIGEAKTILTKAKADFLQIFPVLAMNPLLKTVEAIPTTIFVDAQGKILGEPLVGSRDGASYRKEIEKILKSM